MTTKTWIIKLEVAIDENSHPREFIAEALSEYLKQEEGEDLIDHTYICLEK